MPKLDVTFGDSGKKESKSGLLGGWGTGWSFGGLGSIISGSSDKDKDPEKDTKKPQDLSQFNFELNNDEPNLSLDFGTDSKTDNKTREKDDRDDFDSWAGWGSAGGGNKPKKGKTASSFNSISITSDPIPFGTDRLDGKASIDKAGMGTTFGESDDYGFSFGLDSLGKKSNNQGLLSEGLNKEQEPKPGTGGWGFDAIGTVGKDTEKSS